MKTQTNSGVGTNGRFGEVEEGNRARQDMEAALCEEIIRFEREYMGRQPEKVLAHLRGNLLLIRLHGVLTTAEKELAQQSFTERGTILLKQLRKTLVEMSRPIIEAVVEKVAGAGVLSMHHDLSTVTGEEVLVFTLVESPELT